MLYLTTIQGLFGLQFNLTLTFAEYRVTEGEKGEVEQMDEGKTIIYKLKTHLEN